MNQPQLHSVSIQQIDRFPVIQTKWNSNQVKERPINSNSPLLAENDRQVNEVAQILCSVGSHPEWISQQVRERPQSGTQMLFKRFNDNYFKADGYIWKRRREGKVIREDHMKLKVQKQEIISANYAHSAIVPSFHRRVYWLTTNPDVVLVHYLNSGDDERADGRPLSERITATIKASSLTLSHQDLHTQISPILSPTTSSQEVTALCNAIWQLLNDPHSHNGGAHLERRNSCSSAFRKGLSSVALRRQPSTFSDSIDPHFIGDIVRNCGKVDGGNLGGGHQQNHHLHLEDSNGYARDESHHSHSGDTHHESIDDNETSFYRSRVGASSMSRSNGPSSSGEGWLTPISDITPNKGSIKGDVKVLIIGGWYLKGHEYMVQFGERRVPAQLLQVGVLMVRAPAVREPSTVSVRVLCDGSMVSSTGCEFTYIDENTDNSTHLNIQSLVDRMQLFVAAFNVPQFLNDSPLTTSTLNEETFLSIVRSLLQHQLKNPHLLQPHRNLPSRTLLHLAAALDYHRFTEYLLWWRRSLPYTRELDPLSRDSEGSTPLHLAVKARNFGTVKVLVKACRATVDVLDDRGRTPSDLTSDPGLSKLTARFEEVGKTSGIPTSMEDAEHMAATALWVFTNGETVTDERRQDTQMNRMSVHSSTSPASLREEREREANPMMIKRKADWKDCEPIHVEISMDTADVHVPDSPKMADLFDAVTSPGVFVNDCVREKMAQLAQHIIDALPERIKADPPQNNAQMHSLDDHQAHHGFSFAGESPMFSSNGFVVPELDDYMNLHFGPSTSHQNSFSTKTIPSDDGMSINHSPTFRRSVSHLYPFGGRESFPSSRATTFESGSFDLDNSKDLGEFLNSEATTEIGPLQQQLGDLKLSESEQRDVYEAAKTIQRAYREYRARTSSAPHAEAERNAAITIQSFYRRYKAFQYFKRLYNAAILVQKHFRMKKKDQSGSNESSDPSHDRLPDHPSVDGRSIRIQIPPNSSNLWRENRAAVTIQRSYRDHRHRKRQAAARKIQNFMRQSRIKLRKMHEQSAAGCTMEQGVETEVGVLCLPVSQATTTAHNPVVPHVPRSISQQTHQPIHHQISSSHHHPQPHLPITIDHPMASFSNTTSVCPPPVASLHQPLYHQSIMGIVNLTGMDNKHPQSQRMAQQQLGANVISLQGDPLPTSNNINHPSTHHQQTVPLPPIHTIQPSNNNMLNGK